MKYEYIPRGVCSTKMEIEVNDNIIKAVNITRGCPGNLMGISKIIIGKTIDDVIESFDGIKCGYKTTSCPDQIAKFLKEIKNNTAKHAAN